MNPPERGRLLVAAPSLADPNFFRTVVLLLACDEDGALGVVLNRPSDTPLAEIVPSWALHASEPGVLFSGGPVQPNAAICVGHTAGGLELLETTLAGLEGDLEGYSPLTGTIGTVDLHREPEEVAVSFAGLRVFKGYAGWGPGQLDDEIADEAWFVVDGRPEHILTPEPEGLWEAVLRHEGGWLSVLARHPVDPSLN
ncbi:MAG TPA: YqgE/AlgH family protein [Acidimicrobiales bacterium]|nr:YqgE/AlgH family protein [Acidimicrobiales bacterium]